MVDLHPLDVAVGGQRGGERRRRRAAGHHHLRALAQHAAVAQRQARAALAITPAFCGPGRGAGRDVAGLDGRRRQDRRPCLELDDDPAAVGRSRSGGAGDLWTGLYSTAATAAPSAAVTATPRLIALSSRLHRAIEFSERLCGSPRDGGPRHECQSSGEPVARTLRLCVEPDNRFPRWQTNVRRWSIRHACALVDACRVTRRSARCRLRRPPGHEKGLPQEPDRSVQRPFSRRSPAPSRPPCSSSPTRCRTRTRL